MHIRLRRTLSFTLAIALAAGALPAPVSGRPLSKAEYEACQAQDDQQFWTAIEALTRTALQTALLKVDYAAAVREEWRRGAIGDVIDRQVDRAISDVQSGTSWGDRITSLGSKDKAQELATAVAERTYRSEPMTQALEQLATSVGREVGRSIELGALDAAEPAQECLQAFLGPRYGGTIARVITRDAAKEFNADALRTGVATPQLGPSSGAVAGSVVLILRQSLARMASRVGQRVVGAVLTRLVSVVAGGVGLALIAKDVWDYGGMLWQGILPVVATEMKSSETKAKVQHELATSISEQIGEHVQEVSRATAARIVELWQEFRRGHAKVLELAERNAGFRAFVDTLKPEDLPRLDEVVSIALASEGEARLLARLADGTLARAVTRLPGAAIDIARDTNSLTAALAWTDVAGADLSKVMSFELHKRTKPDAFTTAGLKRLLAFDERLVIQRLSSLPASARDTLFEMPDQEVRGLARGMAEPELEALAAYVTALDRASGRRLLAIVAKEPGRMQALSSSRVRSAVLGSKDQAAAIDMVLRPPGFDVQTIQRDVSAVAVGRVNPVLLWDAHPYAVVAAGVGLLASLLMLKRLVSRRRPAAADA